jgi:hypothetical protein
LYTFLLHCCPGFGFFFFCLMHLFSIFFSTFLVPGLYTHFHNFYCKLSCSQILYHVHIYGSRWYQKVPELLTL